MPDSLFASPLANDRRAFLEAVNQDGPTMPHMQTCCWIFGTSPVHRTKRVDWCGRRIQASHLAIILDGRDPDDGPIVRHACDNPECVRPDHLLVGTLKENSADWRMRGTSKARRIMQEWHEGRGRIPPNPCPPLIERRLGKVSDELIAIDAKVPIHEARRWRRERGILLEPNHLRIPRKGAR